MKKSLIAILIMAASTSATVAWAENNATNNGGGNNNGGDRPHGPPTEAIKACEGKSAGETVQFQTPNGDTISGKCQLIAIPDRAMDSQGGGQGQGGMNGQRGGQNNQGGQQQGQGAKQ